MPLIARITENGDEQPLEEHLDAVATSAERLIGRKTLDFDRLSASELADVARIIGATHDFGKGTTFFQRYLDPDAEFTGKEKRHASLSAYFAYHCLQEAGFDDETALIGWYVVQRHHGNLTSVFVEGGELHRKADDPTHQDRLKKQVADIRNNSASQLEEIYRSLETSGDVAPFLDRMRDDELFDELVDHRFLSQRAFDIEDYYLILLLYSVLLDSDKMNSAGVAFSEWPSVGEDAIADLDPGAVQRYKAAHLATETDLDRERERAAEYVSGAVDALDPDDRLLSVTMPTGSGKTLTALDAALKIRRDADFDRPPRIVYSVPFLSIIDQNHGVFADVLTAADHDPDPSVLLRHDHRSAGYADPDYEGGDDIPTDFLRNPDRALLLTEGWNAELVTTTFVQFFETLLTRRKGNARRFHKLANSVVLLDEIQAVPTKYWGPIREGIRILTETFNSHVVLLTATNPLLFDPGEEITELTDERFAADGAAPPDFDRFDRVSYRHDGQSVGIDELASELAEEAAANPDEDLMAVLNTVHSTRQVYEAVSGAVDRETLYLSTHILPREREERIERINRSDEPLLVVTTQLVEAGVDIDLDIVYRDFAPIDSLVQTAGRCNREAGRDRGTVRIVKLRDDREDAPRQFHYQYVYDPVLTTATESILEGYPTTVSEAEFNAGATREYFEAVNERKGTDAEDLVPAMRSLKAGEVDPRLVQQDFRTVSVFVMRDDRARTAYDSMEEAYTEYHGTACKGALQARKAAFYANVVNVPVSDEASLSHLPTTFIEDVRLVTRDLVGPDEQRHWYDPEIGFRIPDNPLDMRII